MGESLQIEFPMRVAICAWCKPKSRVLDLGTGLGSISHGICPRHLRKLKQSLQSHKNSFRSTPGGASRGRRRRVAADHPELAYCAWETAGAGPATPAKHGE